MTIAKILLTAAAATLAIAPAMAAPSNPAASLSVAKSVRASAPAKKGSQLAGGGVFIAIAAAVAVIVGIVIVANDDDSDSN